MRFSAASLLRQDPDLNVNNCMVCFVPNVVGHQTLVDTAARQVGASEASMVSVVHRAYSDNWLPTRIQEPKISNQWKNAD